MCPVYMTPEGRTWLLRHTVSPGLLVTRQHADAVPSGDATALQTQTHTGGAAVSTLDPRGQCVRCAREPHLLARGRPR